MWTKYNLAKSFEILFKKKKKLENTTKNILILPNFLVWKCWWKDSFRIVSGKSKSPVRKSAKK